MVRTKTNNDTNNPIYYEVLEIPFEFNDINRAPPIILNVFDTDEELLDSTDDFIGRAVIFLNNVTDLAREERIPYPQWYPIKRDFDEEYSEKMGASILCSFSVIESNYQVPAAQIELNRPFTINSQPYPMPSLQQEEFKCEIMVLGLRDLISTGLLPIKKAFVKFNLKSLLPPEKSKAVDNI